jgi:UDP-glucose 4-epimerase
LAVKKTYDKLANDPNNIIAGSRGNLLITGGLGYIGSHTVAEILQRNDLCGFQKIIIIDSLANSKINVLERIFRVPGVPSNARSFVEFE